MQIFHYFLFLVSPKVSCRLNEKECCGTTLLCDTSSSIPACFLKNSDAGECEFGLNVSSQVEKLFQERCY